MSSKVCTAAKNSETTIKVINFLLAIIFKWKMLNLPLSGSCLFAVLNWRKCLVSTPNLIPTYLQRHPLSLVNTPYNFKNVTSCYCVSTSPSCTASEIFTTCLWIPNLHELECGPMPNVMVALPNIGGALCSMPQSLADAHYLTAMQ